MTYPKNDSGSVPSSPRFPEIEERILEFWEQDATFQASIDQRDPGENGANEFVFYDGPPFANGLPHYGHLLTGYVKDLIPRYQTMRGKRVERRFGWDTHGLPAELEAMRLNGIKTTDEILELGIEKFNEACRASVMKYTGEWREYVTRQARWVDFENDYRTMNPDYMESVIWAFKQLHDKGLIYEGFRVLPYCWNDETPLSNHELRMDDDVYQMRQDPAVTVGYDITTEGPFQGVKLLIWTTTPWTLPSNLAVMVGEDIEYVVVAVDGVRYLLAEARLSAYARELGESPEVVWRGVGADLVGLVYDPPSATTAGTSALSASCRPSSSRPPTAPGSCTRPARSVRTTRSSPTARTSKRSCRSARTAGSRSRSPTTRPAGLRREPADHRRSQERWRLGHARHRAAAARDLRPQLPALLALPRAPDLQGRLVVVRRGHRVQAADDGAQPADQLGADHIRDGQFGKWLENARDWSITRNRFWGSPVPVWKSDDPAYPRLDVYGSFEELERDFGRLPRNQAGEPDLHRPYVDDLVRPNPDDPTGKSMMRRVADVLDVWFDSGSMSFAQVHYPFENADWFDGVESGGSASGHFPADFIVEYIGQTRGWFYTLHILATAIFDKPAFENCISHGIVLGSDGNKMSKSLRNYPDVREVFDRDGADAMRWFLMSSPILRGGNLVVTEQGIRDSVRQVLIPLWNSWYFFQLYANAHDGGRGYDAQASTSSSDPLDRYLLAKCRDFVAEMTTALDGYAVADACDATRSFLDVLTNWYIRRSRDRFWEGDADAFDTLFTVLEVVCRATAPLMPLTTEEVWRGLTGARSVHLADWPLAESLPADEALVAAMDKVREACSATSALRKAANLRNRLPLSTLTVVVDDPAALAGFEGIVRDEVNVKEVRLLAAESPEAASYGVEQRLTVNARAAGPRLGRDAQTAIKGSKSGDWSVADDGTVTSGGLVLEEGEYTLETVAGSADSDTATGVLRSGGFVVLDTAVTPELAAEGLARDLVRAVQQARRDAGLEVSDRIALTIAGSADVQAAARTHEQLITGETLATSYAVVAADGSEPAITVVKA